MREISFPTIRRILELHFKGYTRDVIARKVGVSTGTVSNVASLLPESEIEGFRSLSVELRKSGKSVHEALKGAKLQAELDKLSVKLDQLKSFVRASKNSSRKAGYEPKLVVQARMKLSDLEEKSGKSYSEAIIEFEEKTQKSKELDEKNLSSEAQIREKERQIEKLEKERKRRLRLNRITDREIKHVNELEQILRRYGISLTDVEDFKQYLANMKETGGNPRKFVEFTRKHGSLKGRLTYLENQKQKRAAELEAANNRLTELRDEEKKGKY